MCNIVPTVLCGNKVDVADRQVMPKMITYHRKKVDSDGNPYIQYYDISAKSNYNFEKPFLHLARKLTGDADLQFVEAPMIGLGGPVIDQAMIARYERELAECSKVPLPDPDDDF